MEAFLSLFQEETLVQFILLLARVFAFMAFMPIFGHRTIAVKIKATFSFFLAIFLFTTVDVTNDVKEGNFILSLISEIVFGLIGAIIFYVIFAAVRIIGNFIEYATALSMAQMFDPATGSQEGLVTSLLFWISIMIFLNSGMYEMTIVLLAKSFSMVHLGSFNIFSYDGIAIAAKEIHRMFSFAFSFALPLFFIGFIMDIYYGYGTKSMPSFSPFVITFQMKFGLIFLFLLMGFNIFVDSFTDYLISTFS